MNISGSPSQPTNPRIASLNISGTGTGKAAAKVHEAAASVLNGLEISGNSNNQATAKGASHGGGAARQTQAGDNDKADSTDDVNANSVLEITPEPILAVIGKAKFIISTVGGSGSRILGEKDDGAKVNVDYLQTILKCAASKAGIKPDAITDFYLNISSKTVDIEYKDKDNKTIENTIDLVDLEAGNDALKKALKELQNDAKEIKGFEGRILDLDIKKHERIALSNKGPISTPHIDFASKINLTRYGEKNNLHVQDVVQKVLHSKKGEELKINDFISKVTKKRTHLYKEVDKLVAKIRDVELSEELDAKKQANLTKQIEDLNKLKALLGFGSDSDELELIDFKVGTALYIHNMNEAGSVDGGRKEALTRELGHLFLQDKVNGYFQSFKNKLNTFMTGNKVGYISSNISPETLNAETQSIFEKASAKQMAFETVGLLFNAEKDTPTNLVRKQYAEFCKAFATAKPSMQDIDMSGVMPVTRDMSDVLFTIEYDAASVDDSMINRLIESYSLENLTSRAGELVGIFK